MNKKEEEKLLKWKEDQEKKEAVEKATRGRIMLRCSTVLMALWTIALGIGSWAVDHITSLDAAVRAFIQAELSK